MSITAGYCRELNCSRYRAVCYRRCVIYSLCLAVPGDHGLMKPGWVGAATQLGPGGRCARAAEGAGTPARHPPARASPPSALRRVGQYAVRQ